MCLVYILANPRKGLILTFPIGFQHSGDKP